MAGSGVTTKTQPIGLASERPIWHELHSEREGTMYAIDRHGDALLFFKPGNICQSTRVRHCASMDAARAGWADFWREINDRAPRVRMAG